MAVQNIVKYSYKDSFSVSEVQFEKACTIAHNEQQNAYSIYWIQEGKGTYNIDFECYTFTDNMLFFFITRTGIYSGFRRNKNCL
jgi:AraC family transcriptional activator of pobA